MHSATEPARPGGAPPAALDLEFAMSAISNDALPEAAVGEPIVAAPAPPSRPANIAGCRLLVPGASYAALEEAYNEMYMDFFNRRWNDYGDFDFDGEGEPTVILPPDEHNPLPVMLTAFANFSADATEAEGAAVEGAEATRRTHSVHKQDKSRPRGVKSAKPSKEHATARTTSPRGNHNASGRVASPAAEGQAEREAAPLEWQQEQKRLASLACIDDDTLGFVLPWLEKPMVEAPSLPGLEHCPRSMAVTGDGRPPGALRYVGGLDISFVKDTPTAVASLVILEFPGLKPVHTEMLHCEMPVPYIAGYLAFREVEPLQRVIAAAREKVPAMMPQVYFVDGNGILHSRRCGLATHLGVLIDAPTVGVAKNLLNVDSLSRDETVTKVKEKAAEAATTKNTAWDAKVVPLMSRSGAVLGHGSLTGNSTAKPIYVSPGHRISAVSATRLALLMTPFRVVEPIRQADLQSREYIRQHFGDAAGDGAN